MANFDLNFSPPNNKKYLLDLNTIPESSDGHDSQTEDVGDEGNSFHVIQKAIPLRIIPPSNNAGIYIN